MKNFLHQNKNPLLLLIMSAGYLFLYLQKTPVFGEHSSWCLFHLLTGLPCPTCGTGRGLICLLHGEFYNAVMFNPLSYVVAALSIFLFLMILKDWLQKTNSLATLMKVKIPIANQIPFWLLLFIIEAWNIYKGL